MKRIAVVILLVAMLAGCQPGPPVPVYDIGELRVEGSATHADVSFRVWGGSGVNELYNVPLPWAKMTGIVLSGYSFYLAAQSNDAAGDLTVTALIDGVPLATETTADPFGFVAIYGVAP